MTATLARTIAGMSTERLKQIDRLLKEKYVDTGKIAGALTLVARRGEIAHFSPVGLMDAERGKPVKEDTIFRIYSNSKPITSVALMSLYEEGRFQLDQPVSDFIPSWKDLTVYLSGTYPNFVTRRPATTMSVRDLLSHQSGLTYHFHNANNVDAAYRQLNVVGREGSLNWSQDTLAETAAKLANLPLLFDPGTSWNYSVSTDMCGYLVEVISGKRFDTFLQERIFEPLGMVDTAFHVPAEKLERFAACYTALPGDLRMLVDDPATSEYRQPPKLLGGGGGLVSTAHDYYRFGQMLLNKGELDGHRVLSRKTIELMTINHLAGGKELSQVAPAGQFSEAPYGGVGFGLGFSVLKNLAHAKISGSPGHFAWGGAASTAFWVDPVEEVVLVFMTQLLPSSRYAFRRELQVLINSAIVD